MRYVLLLSCVLSALCAPPIAANPIGLTPGGNLDLFADAMGTDEVIWDTPPAGLKLVYVVYAGYWPAPVAVTACQFSAPVPSCFTGVYLSDQNPFPIVLGNSQTGAAVAFGACLQSPVHVMTMQIFGYGTTPECCFWWVRPDPNLPSGQIEVADCSFNVFPATGGATIINRRLDGCPTVAEPSTWGKVKSLYSE